MTGKILEQKDVNKEEPKADIAQKPGLALKTKEESSLLPGNRPVESKHLQIVHTYSSLGAIRPVVKSGIEFMKDTITVSGTRPIALSHLKISETYMGNRPVASNQIDDPELLMGFLD